MKRLLFAALLGVTLFTVVGPVVAEVETQRPEGLDEGVIVTPAPPPNDEWGR